MVKRPPLSTDGYRIPVNIAVIAKSINGIGKRKIDVDIFMIDYEIVIHLDNIFYF